MTSQLIYCHVPSKTPMVDLNGSEYRFPDFIAGETRSFALRFLKNGPTGGLLEYEPNVRSLVASISLIDARPESGRIAYQFGPGPSTAANTTAELPFNHDAQALAAALGALPAVIATYGAAVVEQVPGGFTIYFANATGAVPIQARKNRLWPLTMVRTRAYEVNDEWVQEIRLVQAPMEATSAWVRVLPPVPTIETIRDGVTDASGTYKTTEVQRLDMPPEFRGTYQLRRTDNLARTRLLNRDDSPEEEVKAALQEIYGDEGTIAVTLAGENYALIEFGGDLAGIDVPQLEVVIGDAPPGDPTFTLDLLRPAVYGALRSQATARAFFEIRARIAADDAGEEDEGVPVVLFRREIVLARDQNFDGLTTIVEPRWQRPPNAANYVPTTPDQVDVGISHWSGPVGDGVNASIVIDHDMDTVDIAGILIRANVAGGAVLPAADYSVEITDANSITITFDDVPAVDEYVVVIAGAVPVSQWEPHTHTKGQIVGLEEDLEELFGRVADLEAYIPSISGLATGAAKGTLSIEIPTTAEVLFYRGEEAAWSDKGLSVAKLPPRAPYLLPAVHDAAVDNVTAVPASATGNAGKVYKNNAAPDLLVASGGRIRSSVVKQNELFACDGRGFYKVQRDAATNSYYPAAFERELWMLFISDQMLRVGKTFELQFGVQILTALATSRAQWTLRIEKGTAPQDTSPAPVGLNLQDIVWDAAPMIEQRLIITPLATSHFIGVRIARGAAEITSDKMLYGTWEGNNAAAPAGANFALRATLTKFDTENSIPTATGHIAYRIIGSMNTDGATSTEAPKALIY